jgi:hypothetical protein
MRKGQPLKSINYPLTFKVVIWLLGTVAWLFGSVDRVFAVLADGRFSILDAIQLGTVIFFFLIWFYLKPELKLNSKFLSRLNNSLR